MIGSGGGGSIEQDMRAAIESILHGIPVSIAYVPADQTDSVTVRRTGGNDLICYDRAEKSGRVSRPQMQVYVQSARYDDGQHICETIVDCLDGIPRRGFTAFLQGGMIPLGRGKNQAGEIHMFSLNFNCTEDR